jgi:hypothetical protein
VSRSRFVFVSALLVTIASLAGLLLAAFPLYHLTLYLPWLAAKS